MSELMSELSRYEINSAGYKVDGYVMKEYTEETFLKGKAECLKHMARQIACIEQLTFAQFEKLRRKMFNG